MSQHLSFYLHQAFRVGKRIYSVLFHLEVTAEMIQTWLQTFAHELTNVRSHIDPTVIEKDLTERATRLNSLAQKFMRKFCGLL